MRKMPENTIKSGNCLQSKNQYRGVEFVVSIIESFFGSGIIVRVTEEFGGSLVVVGGSNGAG